MSDIATIGDLLVRLRLDSSDYNDNLRRAQRNTQNSFDAMKNTGATMTAIGSGLAAGLGLAVKSTMDFDAQMSKVQALSGSTSEQFGQLRDQAIKLGSDTSFSASQAASGMQMLAASGMDANKIMGAMPGVLSAAAASGEEMALVAETMGNALNIFGLEATQSTHVADVLSQVANQSSAGIQDMAYSMKYVGPVAAQLGISLEEVGAATIEMANAGIKGEQSGTTLRSALLSLVDPSKEAKAQLDSLKVSVTDSSGKMLPMGDIIGQLNTKMAGMTEAQKAATLAQIFGKEAVSGMMVLISQGKDKFDEYTNSLKNSTGASQAAAEVMKNNLKGSMDQLSGAFESASISIGSALAPSIRAVADNVAGLVNWFNQLPGPAKETAAQAVAAAAGLLLIGGPLLILAGSLPSIVAGFGAMGTALAVATGPVGLAVAAVGLLALAGHGVYKALNEKAIPEVDHFGSSVSDASQKATKGFLDLNDTATRLLTDLSVSGKAVTTEMAGSLTSTFDNMGKQIVASLDQQHKDSLDKMRQFFANSSALTEGEEVAALEKISQDYEGRKAKVQEGEAKIKEILTVASQEKRALTDQERQDINRIKQEMADVGVNNLAKSETDAKVILERMKQQTGEITAQQAAEVTKNSAKQRDDAVAVAGDQYSKVVAEIARQRDEVKTISADQAEKLIADATRQRDEAVEKAKDGHQKVVEEAKKQAADHINEINWETGEARSKWDAFWYDFGQRQSAGLNKMGENFTKYWTGQGQEFDEAWNNALNKTEAFFVNIGRSVESGTNNVVSWFSNMGSEIGSGISELSSSAYQWGRDIIDGLIGGMRSLHIPMPRFDFSVDYRSVAGVSFPVPDVDVEWYKTGGIFTSPTIAGIGDVPEAVTPLSELPDLMAKALAGAMQLLGTQPAVATVDASQPINITLTLDGAVLSRQLYYLNQGKLRGAGA